MRSRLRPFREVGNYHSEPESSPNSVPHLEEVKESRDKVSVGEPAYSSEASVMKDWALMLLCCVQVIKTRPEATNQLTKSLMGTGWVGIIAFSACSALAGRQTI